MKIAEINSPDLRLQDTLLSGTVNQIESLVKQSELFSPKSSSSPSTIHPQLRQCIAQLSQLAPSSFPNSLKLHLWKLSYRLWNSCVDLTNSGVKGHVELRRAAADMLAIAGDVSGVPSPAMKAASFYYKTGLIWHDMEQFEFANDCYEKASDLVAKVADIDAISDLGERKLLLDLNIARARTAWEVSDRNVSIALLNRAKKFVFDVAENYRSLAEQYLLFGKKALVRGAVSEGNEALKLMNECLELCEKGLRVVKKTEETLILKSLRDKTLRFIAALHLQREEFDSVVKCVRVLRDHSGVKGSDEHPSLSVLAMKAWLGFGRFSEAEKELRDMVVNKMIPESIWVSAVEAYFKAVGVAGVETVKSIFLGLLQRCQVSAGAAVRVIYKVIGEGGGGGKEGLRIREIMAEELVCDDRVVALFAGEKAAKESTAMHAILWNSAVAHFRSKEYEISAGLFEKAMLYVPSGVDKRNLRAKGFRVLCLCYLGLSQLDQAKEYIVEAEKLEPSIASAFLKFKICLQKKDHVAAITQMKSMMSCTDFTTAYLSLAAHEAVACRALPVAVSSLCDLLNFYTSGKSMPIAEVVVFRTILMILVQESGHELEVLEYMKKAQTRITELGPDNFFGKGEIGRREQNWFATNAWNVGTKAGAGKNYELSAEFLSLAAEFYDIKIDREAEGNNMMFCKSIILSVSAMISAEKQNKVAMSSAQVKKAIELFDRVGKLVEALSTSENLADCKDSSLNPQFHLVYLLNAYELYGRIRDSKSQQLLVKNYVNSKVCNTKHLLQLGLTASQGPQLNVEVATFTLNACLTALLATPLPDYEDVALIIRRLITIAVVYKGDADDEVVYNLYKQAHRIMSGLREGEYPAAEGKWLATTAWNRASVPVRLEQTDGAKKWMSMGLEIAKKVPGMDTYKSLMEDYVAGFEKRLQYDEEKRSKLTS